MDCVHSFIHLSIRWLVDSFISSILSSIHWNIVSLIHSFTPSFLHSLIHPFVHSLLHAFAHLFFHVSDFICFHVMSFACQKPCAHCINLCTSQPWPYIASAFHRHTFRPLIPYRHSSFGDFRPGTARHYWYFHIVLSTLANRKKVKECFWKILVYCCISLASCYCTVCAPVCLFWQRSATDSSACWGKFPATAGYRFSRWTKILTMHCLLCFRWGIFASAWTPVQIFPLYFGRGRPSYKWIIIYRHFVVTMSPLTRAFCNRAPKRQSCTFWSVHVVRVLRCQLIL